MKRKEGLRQRARELRARGYSYTEIVKEVPVSKSSISLWCRDIPLTVAYKQRLRKISLEGLGKGRQRWAEIRRDDKQRLLEKIALKSQQDIGKLSERDRFIAGLMLYAGEGDRTGERIGMSNSNPYLLLFALNWLCEFLELDRGHFNVHLYLHVGLNEKKARAFWVETLRISKEQIRYVYRPIPRTSHKGNVHKFGICSVRFHNRMAHRQLMGWIQAVLNNNQLNIPG